MKTTSSIRLFFATSFCVLCIATAQAQQTYIAFMDGPSEAPPNGSPGTGFAQITINLTTHILQVHADFTGLMGTTTAAHIHSPTAMPFTSTAGVATQQPSFNGFPLGVTNGTYDMSFDLTQNGSWNPTYITNNGGTPATAEAAFAQQLSEGRAYFNIHTSSFGGGEIRGFLVVPEPSTVGLLVIGGLGVLLGARRARRRN